MFLADLYNNKRLFENISPIDLAEILFNALMQKYPEAVKRYGHEVVGDAVMNYAEDSEDIRSMSDVDIAVQEILDDLANYRGDRTNDLEPDGDAPLQEDLRKWFKEKWVRFGPDGKIRGACARGDESEGKPKCLPQAKAHALGKKGRKYAAAKKRREDPDPERRGPAKNVATKKKTNEGVAEGLLNEFAPGGNSASSYYAVTANFVSEFSQQKEEEIQDLIAAGWTKQDLAQAGTLQGQAADIAHFEQVRDSFLKGLKPGFDAYLQGDTQMKDQLGEYWLENDLPLNQDWEKIYGEPWGDDTGFAEGVAEGRFDEPLTGWHIVYRKSGNPVHATPSFETKDQAQKYLMTKMFANHQDYKVVHTAGVGVAEGFFGTDDKIKGKIQNLVSRLSDEYGMWDHKAQTFTPQGLETLKSMLKFNEKYIKYALSLTHKDYEAEGVAEGLNDKKSTVTTFVTGCDWDKVVEWLEKNIGQTTLKSPNYINGWRGQGWALFLNPSRYEPGKLAFQVRANTDLSEEELKSQIEMFCKGVAETQQLCPECGGPAFSDLVLAEKQDACYHKVKSRYKVWPSAYASGALVQCRKKGAANWGKKKTNEAKESPTQDYQKMMNFVQAQRLSGVPPEQQVAVALFKELEKTKAFNKELDAELKAAEERLGVSAKQGELTGKELSKHRGELEKEKAAGAKQRAAMGDFEKVSAEREQASNRQLQGLTQKLEQLKAKPGIDPAATAALERQIAELEQKMQDKQGTGVAADKIAELERAIADVQKGETVDASAIERLEQEFKAAQTAAQSAQAKLGQVKDYESQIAKLNAEVDNLEKAVAGTLKPEVDKLDKQVFTQGNLLNQVIQKTNVPANIKNAPDYANNLADVAKKQLRTTNQRPIVQNPQIPPDIMLKEPVTETRFYFTVKATLAETLRGDFAMTQDSEGWYLTAAQGPAKLLEAQRAFGIPKVKQVKLKEVRISDYTGRAGTIGDENATSPIGSLPRQGRRPA